PTKSAAAFPTNPTRATGTPQSFETKRPASITAGPTITTRTAAEPAGAPGSARAAQQTGITPGPTHTP
ncbi:hypothetical protein, partial [Mycobacterium marinum]|uniref:hypothetical protein n=1 Tax=Mycobacterium marinum TaxID=1781 RepID=UPI003569053E